MKSPLADVKSPLPAAARGPGGEEDDIPTEELAHGAGSIAVPAQGDASKSKFERMMEEKGERGLIPPRLPSPLCGLNPTFLLSGYDTAVEPEGYRFDDVAPMPLPQLGGQVRGPVGSLQALD